MKTLLAIMTGVLACSWAMAQSDIAPARPGVTYGKPVDGQNALTVVELSEQLETDTLFIGKVEGEVTEVCKKKGCFMKLKRAGAEPVMVRFKDYGFFMPQDIVGKTIAADGTARVKETSVERLRHWARDAGKSDAEIEQIKEPETDIEMIAEGVVVVK